MWNRVYITALAAFTLILASITYYSWSWLRSIGSPTAAIAGFDTSDAIGWTFLWLTTVVLLVIANFVLARTLRAWALWTTFLYFGVFVVIKYFWLSVSATSFLRANDLDSGSYILGPFLALMLCVGFGAVVFLDQLVLVKISNRIYPPKDGAENDVGEMPESAEENNRSI